MAALIVYHRAAFLRLTEGAINEGIKAATLELQKIARKMTSTANKGVPKKRKRATSRGGKGSQYTTYPHSSKAGEPVRRRTGFGQKSITMGLNPSKQTGRVGYTKNARYMLFHELGIRYRGGLQKRPTLVPAIVKNRTRLGKIASFVATRYAERRGE